MLLLLSLFSMVVTVLDDIVSNGRGGCCGCHFSEGCNFLRSEFVTSHDTFKTSLGIGLMMLKSRNFLRSEFVTSHDTFKTSLGIGLMMRRSLTSHKITSATMSTKKRLENRNPGGSSLYPLHPVTTASNGKGASRDGDNVRIVFRIPVQDDLTLWDRCVVAGTSLGVVGAFAWVPLLYLYGAWRLYKSIPPLSSSTSSADDDDRDDDANEQQRQAVQRHRRRRAMIVASIVAATVALLTTHGPHRSPRFGRWLRIRHWKMWMSWLKFIAMEVIVDQTPSDTKVAAHSHELTQRQLALLQQPNEQEQQQAMLAFVPHGIFPFAFAFGALPALSQRAFGIFRPVVATATNFFPVVSDFLLWLHKMYVYWYIYTSTAVVDAAAAAVAALSMRKRCVAARR
jgi:hypothetical protein